jgi:hypothetical protein
MSDLVGIFKGAENAKELQGFAPNLPNGEHTLLLKRFNVKDSNKGMGKRVEADFLVVESSAPDLVGTTRGWPWFIGAPGWQGQYAESRLKEFLTAVATGIGDTSPISTIGAGLAGDAQLGRGMMIKCSIVDGKPRKAPGTGFYQEVSWIPVTQTLDDIKRGRSYIDAESPAPAVQQAPAQEPAVQRVPAVQQAPAQTQSAGMSALLAGLKR